MANTPSDDSSEPDQTQFSDSSGPVGNNTDAMRQVGIQLGEFRLLRRLGKGGMAEVWMAEQLSLKRNVALKLLRSDMMEDETYVARFQTEAKAAAGLNHPNIVQVYTVGCELGQHFIAQEYVQGQTLKDLLKQHKQLEVNLALHIMKQVASAMKTASERGIVHRDIKPDNIMITKKKVAKVADFGLAQLQGGERLNLTQEGVTMGTPLYMSPEQVSGKNVDGRSDIYSFGVSCYHLLAGEPPFQGENAVSIAMQHLNDKPKPLTEARPDLPKAVCKIVERMMAKNPDERYQTASKMLEDIKRIAKRVKLGEDTDDDAAGESPVSNFPVRRPALVMPLLCVAIGLLSAGIGLAMRPSIPKNEGGNSAIKTLATAEEQFLQAMFMVKSEDAFLKVISEFTNPKDNIWTQRAHEQLALMYMKDLPRRAEDAAVHLGKLESSRDPMHRAEAIIGQTYLILRDNSLSPEVRNQRAQSRYNAGDFDYLSGSWKQHEEDVRRILEHGNRPPRGKEGPYRGDGRPRGNGPPPEGKPENE